MSLQRLIVFRNFETSGFYLEFEEKLSLLTYSETLKKKSATGTFSRPMAHTKMIIKGDKSAENIFPGMQYGSPSEELTHVL